MAIYQLGEDAPRLHATAWVAESASVVGRVSLAEGCGVWYGSVLRGDNEWLTVGRHSNIQDGCVLHSDHGFPLTVGERVTVGHKVLLHGCTVADGALIGMGAVVLNGARIGKNCLVGAGALVTEGKEFAEGMLIIGSPAKAVRALTPEQIEHLGLAAAHYVKNAQLHRTAIKLA